MRNRVLTGVSVIVLGLLVSIGPQSLFKVCGPVAAHDGAGPSWMKCHWTGQAEIGAGALVAALGVLLLVSASVGARLALSAAVGLAAILVLALPHGLIGGCGMATMPCRSVAFPALTVLAVLLLALAGGNILFLRLTGGRHE